MINIHQHTMNILAYLFIIIVNFLTTNAETRCHCTARENILECSNLMDTKQLCRSTPENVGDAKITRLQISNSSLEFNMSMVTLLSKLNLRPLQLTSLSIRNTDISSISTESLANLEHLDLSCNNLTGLKEPVLPNIKSISLSGNPWNCFIVEQNSWTYSSLDHVIDLAWLMDDFWSDHWIDKNQTFCDPPPLNSTAIKKHLKQRQAISSFHKTCMMKGLNLKEFLTLHQNTSAICPKRCSCGIARELKMKLPFKISIVCRGLNLTELPSNLPNNTLALDISYNFLRNTFVDLSKPEYKKI